MGSLFPISSARGLLGQPIAAYNWEIVFPELPAAVAKYAESLSVKARSVSIPGVQGEGSETNFGPFVFSHPGKKTYPRKLSMTFEEAYSNPVVEALKLWAQLIFDEESGAGAEEEALKSDVWIRLLGPDPEGDPQSFDGAIHVYNAFPVSVPDTSLDYSSDAAIMVSVTMAYNLWRWESWPF